MTTALQTDLLITGISQLATPVGAAAKHGAQMSEIEIIEDGAIAISAGRFVWIGKHEDWLGHAAVTVDLGGRAVVPGLVDPHTHAVWAGDRLADFEARASGATYEQILAAGGGIRSTIRSTALASHEELVALARPRLDALIHSGATVIEVKSGYGFTPAAEIKMLEAIHALTRESRARILPTLLIHIPPVNESERAAYLDQVTTELIPEAAWRKLAVVVDIFIEREAFDASEAERVLLCAKAHGLKFKVHTEQFHSVGGLELALRAGALSVDHLEACTPAQYPLFAASNTIATILTGVSLHLGIPAAPGRGLIDGGAAVAVGTDLNPGSSPLFSMSTALALAVRLNGLTAREALVAGTVNAACAVGIADAGRIEPGLPADFLVLKDRDWRSLVYLLGENPVRETWLSGARMPQPENNP